MSRTDPNNGPHPDELLGAYALDILDEEEAVRVEAHLTACFHCRETDNGLRAAAAVLGRWVDELPAPPSLRAQIMGALPRVEVRGAVPARAAAGTRRWSLIGRVLMPLGAVLMIGLVSYNVVLNLLMSNRLDELQRENTMMARLVLLPPKEPQYMDAVRQLQVASYWLGDSDSIPMILESPSRVGMSQGVLLVADDGRRAMLMVSGMKRLTPPSSYQVWLLRQGQRDWVGQVKVDSRGWGAVTLHPKEPLFRFESVQLTTQDTEGGKPGLEDMVLQGQIVAQKFSK